MNPLFEKYKPSIDKILDKGDYLTPISDSQTFNEEYIMEEHRTNIYGDIITGLILASFILVLLFADIELNGNEIAFYCYIAFMSLGSIVLVSSGINKISNPNNKSSISINSKRIRHYDSIKSRSKTIKWVDIKDIVIKFYRRKNGYDKYILIQNIDDKVIGLDITYLYEKGKKTIFKDDLKTIATMQEPEYTELRKILGNYLEK